MRTETEEEQLSRERYLAIVKIVKEINRVECERHTLERCRSFLEEEILKFEMAESSALSDTMKIQKERDTAELYRLYENERRNIELNEEELKLLKRQKDEFWNGKRADFIREIKKIIHNAEIEKEGNYLKYSKLKDQFDVKKLSKESS